MKNFDDMGLIEMAKTLGEMGDEMKREELQCICECQDCGSYDYRTKDKSGCPYHNSINHLRTQNAELLDALRCLTKEIDLGKLSIRKDFSLINAHAYALRAIYKAEGGK